MPSIDLIQEELDTLVTLFQKVGGSPTESRRKFMNSAEEKMMNAGGRILSWAEPCHDIVYTPVGRLTFRDNLQEVLDFDYDAVLDFEPLEDTLRRADPDMPDLFFGS